MPANAAYPFLDWPGPIAFAHRGGASEAPENTMPAFEHAVRLGYRYLETDAHVTADGVLVAFHDDRLDRVTDRTGVIAELPWSRGAARPRSTAASRSRSSRTCSPPGPTCASTSTRSTTPSPSRSPRPSSAPGAVDRVCVGAFSDRRIATVKALVGPGAVHVDGAARGGPAGVGVARAARGGPASWSPCAQVPTTPGSRSAGDPAVRRHRPPARRAGARVDDRRRATRWRASSTSASTGS